jgi:iron complex outermembrane receptor protein
MVDFNNQVTVAQVQDIFKIGGAHTLRLSGEYRKGDLNTSPFRGGTVFYDGCALGVMWQWRLAETLTLTNAIRRDDLELGRKGLVPAGYGLGNSDWDRSLAKTSFNAGLVWATSDQDTVRLSASRGAQLPSLYNLGGFLINYPLPPSAPLPAIFFSGVPGLQPATVNNYELAWDRKLTVIEADLRMAVFHGTSRGVLADNGADLQEAAIFSTPANIGNSETDGLELSLQGTIADTWRWRAGYLYQDVDDSFTALFPAESTLTDFATTTPRHNLNASLGWTKGAWEVDGYLKYQSSTLGLQGPDAIVFPPAGALGSLVQVPGYTSVDARIAYSMDDKLVFSLSGQNLLDSEQRQTSGPDVERRVLATATYSF